MNESISKIREKILKSDEFVLSEIKKLQYLYGLKQIIRTKQNRKENIQTESVAEHIYSLNILSRYFLPLEDLNENLDQQLVYSLILWHEIDEIENGDVVPWEKSETIKNQLKDDYELALTKIPNLLKSEAKLMFCHYEANESPEAKFVKAIDKIDPVIDSYTNEGKKRMLDYGITAEQNLAIKLPYINDYPYIKRFNDVIHERFVSEGFF